MRIRAAVLESFGRPLVVQDLDLAGPREGEVLVRVHACGVCHTDLYTASGADPSGYTPCVLGHEGAGVVEAVGPGVSALRPGDHVITLEHDYQRNLAEDRGMTSWNLVSKNNQDTVSGIYLYHVTNPETGQESVGKFVIIR